MWLFNMRFVKLQSRIFSPFYISPIRSTFVSSFDNDMNVSSRALFCQTEITGRKNKFFQTRQFNGINLILKYNQCHENHLANDTICHCQRFPPSYKKANCFSVQHLEVWEVVNEFYFFFVNCFVRFPYHSA